MARKAVVLVMLAFASGISSSAQEALPDLVISNVTQDIADPYPGNRIEFKVTVTNQGGAMKNGTTVEVRVDHGGSRTSSIPALYPGESVDVTYTYNSSSNPASQDHELQAVVDPDLLVVESNEFNNSATKPFTVDLPDLIIEEISWSPASPAVGDQVTFRAILKNQGRHEWRAEAGVMADVELRINGSTIPQLTGSGLSYIAYNVTVNGALAAGASVEISGWGTWTVTDPPPGTSSHRIRVNADSANHVDEVTRNNNVLEKDM